MTEISPGFSLLQVPITRSNKFHFQYQDEPSSRHAQRVRVRVATQGSHSQLHWTLVLGHTPQAIHVPESAWGPCMTNEFPPRLTKASPLKTDASRQYLLVKPHFRHRTRYWPFAKRKSTWKNSLQLRFSYSTVPGVSIHFFVLSAHVWRCLSSRESYLGVSLSARPHGEPF